MYSDKPPPMSAGIIPIEKYKHENADSNRNFQPETSSPTLKSSET
jgi:hypothetical protein